MPEERTEGHPTPPRPTEKELFFAALDIEDPKERSAWLQEACGKDDRLHQRVRDLLAAEVAEAGDFLAPDPERLGHVVSAVGHELRGEQTDPGADTISSDPGDDLAIGAGIREQPGDTIGRYKLLQRIGEGGGGVVYMADQVEPVKRRVALKVIKLGMDTHQVVARFEAERQALAMMDHPNIAKVLDAGATESGRPYFVMELVRGVPITTFCDENKLSTVERLELFIQVCEAVQHAHQKGIIHRDLKPGNVLVTMMEDRPVPKVIDFGVAKATQQELTEKTLFTQHGHFLGTPAYMSPEQASLAGYDIDTRSDIYALGVLLYELLTGQTPFDSTQLLKAGYDEIRRVIAEDEPPKPSTRISTMDDGELTALAGHRQSGPHRLSRLVRGDLDWIVMKALEKDRRRRYETANGFAMDVRRHLANEPVTAGRPSLVYKAVKFARRNRRLLASGAASVIALLLGLSTAGGIWFQEHQRVTQVQQSAGDLIASAEQLMEDHMASDSYDDDASFRQARELAHRAGDLLKENSRGTGAIHEHSRRLLAAVASEDRARSLISSIEEALLKKTSIGRDSESITEARTSDLTDSLANAFAEFGMNPLEETPEETVAQITKHRKTVRDRILVGLGAWSTALQDSEAERAGRLEEIIAQADSDPWRRDLREGIRKKDGEALKALADSPEIAKQPIMTVMQLCSVLREQDLAAPVEQLLRRAQIEAPGSFWTNYALGQALFGALSRKDFLEKTDFDIGPNGMSLGGISFGDDLDGPLQSAANPEASKYDEAIGFLRAAVASRPDAGMGIVHLASVLIARGHLDEAIAILERTASEVPDREILDITIAAALLKQGRLQEALPYLRRAADREGELPGPQGILGMTLAQLGSYEEARAALTKAGEIEARISSGGESDPDHDPTGGFILNDVPRKIDEDTISMIIVMAQCTRGDYLDALEICRGILENNPDDADAHQMRGLILLNMGEDAASLAALDTAIQAGLRTPDLLNTYALLLCQLGDPQGALPYLEEALKLEPKEADIHSTHGYCLMLLGRTDEAEPSCRKALELNPQSALAWTSRGLA